MIADKSVDWYNLVNSI